MKVTPTTLPDVLVLEPQVFSDHRGSLFESYNRRTFTQATGIDVEFVQDNHTRSAGGVLRGLHYQVGQPQGKLIRVTAGEIFDICVDLRRSSAGFGKWTGLTLSAANRQMIWIPGGFAHGFLVVSDGAEVQYKCTAFRAPECERTLAWNDPQLAIRWPLAGEPVLSQKDAQGTPLGLAEVFD